MNLAKIQELLKKIRVIPGIGLASQFDQQAYDANVHSEYANSILDPKNMMLLKASENLSLFCTHLKNQERRAKNLPAKDLSQEYFLKYVHNVKKSILHDTKELEKLKSNRTPNDEISTQEQYCMNMLLIHLQQLEVLAEIAKSKLEIASGTSQALSEKESDEIGEAFKYLETLKDLDKAVVTLQEVFANTKATPISTSNISPEEALQAKAEAKALTEILKTGISSVEQYPNKLSNNRMGGWAQKKFQHASRNEQLNLLLNCLNNLKNSEIDTQTALITKGLMLAIKHQLDKEWFSANSKLREKVDGILKNDIFSADNDKRAIKAFQEYAHASKGKNALNISTKMLGKIDTATQDYELGLVNRIRKG